jgi:hypothetical protein
MKKSPIRDQKWLMNDRKSSDIRKSIKYPSQLDRENTWRKHKNYRAISDLYDAYRAIVEIIPAEQRSPRSMSVQMAAWLRGQRRIEPSASSFRRFFKIYQIFSVSVVNTDLPPMGTGPD